ncbi:MAG: hypothetical protein CMP51_00095 [Flavobacteriales bacterium]|nr:hypothetical protein [Flavobacteriales bacterium]
MNIPSYISIDSTILNTNLQVEGKNTKNITDVWIYADDQFKGAFEIPCTIPLIKEGNTNIKIFAGIKDNGIAGTRVRYHFYKSFENNILLTKDSITNITPEFEYLNNAKFEIESFEGAGYNIDTTTNSEINYSILQDINNNNYGSAILQNNLVFEISTQDFESLPQGGSPVYLEIDYRTNHNILAGAYINYPFLVDNKELLWITPKEDWNKIYINMTKTVSKALNNNSIKFYFRMYRTDTTEPSWFEFDNIKLIY